MSKNGNMPFMNLYGDDLLAHMAETDEHPAVTGARTRLWCFALRQDPIGTLPNDQKMLKKWSKLYGTRWEKAWKVIKSSWEYEPKTDRWLIKRIMSQQQGRHTFLEHQRHAARAKQDKKKGVPGHAGTPVPGRPQTSPPTPTPTPTPTLKRRLREEPLLTPKEVKKEEKKQSNVDNSPRKPITDWLNPEEKIQLEELIPSVMEANRSTFPKIQNLLRHWMQIRPPWPVCQSILEKIRQYHPEEPEGYAHKIMAIEEGNYHAGQAVARHAGIKEAEQKPVPIVQITRGMEHIGAIPVLKSLSQRAEEAPDEDVG